jgi:predicted nucleotidyltransferase
VLTKQDILDFLRNNKSDLATTYHIRNIGIIGSYARDEQGGKSDIDFIIEFNDNVEDIFEAKFKLRQFLQSNLKRNVDICRKKYLKPFVKDSILKEAIYG